MVEKESASQKNPRKDITTHEPEKKSRLGTYLETKRRNAGSKLKGYLESKRKSMQPIKDAFIDSFMGRDKSTARTIEGRIDYLKARIGMVRVAGGALVTTFVASSAIAVYGVYQAATVANYSVITTQPIATIAAIGTGLALFSTMGETDTPILQSRIRKLEAKKRR